MIPPSLHQMVLCIIKTIAVISLHLRYDGGNNETKVYVEESMQGIMKVVDYDDTDKSSNDMDPAIEEDREDTNGKAMWNGSIPVNGKNSVGIVSDEGRN